MAAISKKILSLSLAFLAGAAFAPSPAMAKNQTAPGTACSKPIIVSGTADLGRLLGKHHSSKGNIQLMCDSSGNISGLQTITANDGGNQESHFIPVSALTPNKAVPITQVAGNTYVSLQALNNFNATNGGLVNVLFKGDPKDNLVLNLTRDPLSPGNWNITYTSVRQTLVGPLNSLNLELRDGEVKQAQAAGYACQASDCPGGAIIGEGFLIKISDGSLPQTGPTPATAIPTI